MNELTVKSVDVMGDSIMAAKDKDGAIWAGVSYFCNALGMTRGQKNRQVKNVQKDETLKMGCTRLEAGALDDGNEAIALRIDYIPIWLAKINITQKTREERPDFAKKLLDYQLKAKDILAAAFLPKQTSVPQTVPEQIRLLAQGHTELKAEVDSIKEEVENIKSDMPVLPVEADMIVRAVKKKGVAVLGGKKSKAYKNQAIRQKVYTDLYWEMKHQFNVRTYKAIRRADTEKAVQIAEQYKPPLYLEKEIAEANK